MIVLIVRSCPISVICTKYIFPFLTSPLKVSQYNFSFISYLWPELEETLLWRPDFTFGGLELSLFFLFFLDTFFFSSEELKVDEEQKVTH